MLSALQMAGDDEDLKAAVIHSRKLLNKRALASAVASAVPIPGLDMAVDAALLAKLIPEINKVFGLTPNQLSQLNPEKREQVHKATSLVGSALIGKLITKDLVIKVIANLGMRMGTKQLSKYIPFAGQLLAASVGYAAIRYFGEEHMKDCIRVAQKAELLLPQLGYSKPESTIKSIE
ncbi:hypothetical protein HC248_01659 [Polaromonas vacuolata]|uniref:DUF697 domain-containing protein n=2 Tax=Polaromonas vacuolata TaxID=37448 RepID=A0A6H2H9T3_9BURK|nr:hypothetical protein [Polaromonas vacuolata]QJC56354.1 hypothetical protein HC248_01659 [Polaromonas vacuolata]